MLPKRGDNLHHRTGILGSDECHNLAREFADRVSLPLAREIDTYRAWASSGGSVLSNEVILYCSALVTPAISKGTGKVIEAITLIPEDTSEDDALLQENSL